MMNVTDQEKLVLETYREERTVKKVAKKLQLPRNVVNDIIAKNNAYKRKNQTTKETEELIIEKYKSGISTEKIAVELGISPSTACRILKRNDIPIQGATHFNRKYPVKEGFLDVINTQEKAYFLGFMYADGCVHKKYGSFGLTLHKKDRDILEKFSLLFYDQSLVSEDEPYVEWGVYSRVLHDKLVGHGCVPAKSFKVKLPKHLPKDLMSHFLRGVYDGDGCINICESGRVRINLTGFYDFLEEIKEYLSTLKISSILREVKPKVGSLNVSKKYDSQKMLEFLYKDSKIHLDRKYKKYQDAMEILIEKNKKPACYSRNILSYHGNKLYGKYIKTLSLEEKDKVADFVFDYFRQYGFPYEDFENNELINDFKDLCKKEVTLSANKELYNISNAGLKIFKQFCHHYYTVTNGSQPSLVEGFNNDELLMKVIKNRLGYFFANGEAFNITGNMIRQGFRNSRIAFAASVFKPAVAKFFYDKFQAQNVLDISAGFGQRMVGAMAAVSVRKYTGIDPWSETIEALGVIKDFLNFECLVQKDIQLVETGSEDFVTKERFDFCFSSPPFFDKEIYSTDPGQAYNSGLDKFLEYWRKTAENVHTMLSGKYFVLNMDSKIIIDMLTKVSDLFVLEDSYKINFKRAHLAYNSADTYYILRKV